MIEGKLELDGHEPRNVQVVVSMEGKSGRVLQLVGAEGPFLQVTLPRTMEPQESSIEEEGSEGVETGRDGSEDEGTDSTNALEHAREENRLLQEEVQKVRGELTGVQERMKSLWEANCFLAREFDEIVFAKDEEIAELKCQLASRPGDAPTGSSL